MDTKSIKFLLKASDATKRLSEPKMAKLSSNKWLKNEKHEFNMTKRKDNAQFASVTSKQVCFAVGWP